MCIGFLLAASMSSRSWAPFRIYVEMRSSNRRPSAVRGWSWVSGLLRRPVAVFIVLATLFGIAALVLIPPLRGADEPAHFLRAYGIAHGQVVPSLADELGRKGIFLPARIHDD